MGLRAVGSVWHRTRGKLFASLVCLAFGCVPASTAAAAPVPVPFAPQPGAPSSAPAPRYVPGELIVRFRPGAAAAERNALNATQGARELRRMLVPRAFLLRLPNGRDVPAAARAYERNPNVDFAQPNYIDEPVSTTPNDSSFSLLWGLHNTGQTVNGVAGTPDADIDAPEAWDVTQGNTAVTVGVADTGIAYNHPDLAANVWQNPGESGGGKEANGLDDDGNGRIDDFRGYDFVDGDNDPIDDHGHGSHVAGTIGAVGNNGTGVTGVNWQVKLAPLRICSPDPFVLCDQAAQADAFAYAGLMGMKVVNASISGPSSGQVVSDAIAAAPGTLFVFAAGNENNNNDTNPQYPCGYSPANIVCVAATDADDDRAPFSNYGASAVDLAAPGTSILSTYPFTVPFEDDFQVANFSSRWTTGGTRNTWGRVCGGGECSMTDSPTGNYRNNTNSWSRTASTFNLSGMSDCRVQYFLWLNTEQGFDGIFVEASTNGTSWTELAAWSGTSGGWIWLDEDLSAFDGQPNVYLRYRLLTDGSQTGDGAYVDDVAVRCTRSAYAGNEYAYLQGTSMATPHVTGAAALAWARVPGASPAEVRDALLQGVDAKASLSGLVASGGRLNLARTLERVSVLAAGHVRPKAASPLRVSLVPAYTQCATPNRDHGPPLAFGSCAPPVQRSTQLTVGTVDANGQTPNSVGSLHMKVLVGDPATPADESDVRLSVNVTDVRRKSNLADYGGELEARATLRLTDRLNGSGLDDSATLGDLPFEFVVPCAGTVDTGTGSVCSISTTADAVYPGVVAEGARAVWQLNQVTVTDGGTDGLGGTDPNGVFAVQGVFIP
ncbi:MAG: S8 family serine peptidase [Solirubrobacterales bacterium]